MSGRSHKEVALRRTRGHASTASFVHAEGQKVIPRWQQRYLDRIREGRCPRCNNEVDEDTKAGLVVVKGKVVHTCVNCRLGRQIDYEAKKKEVAMGTLMGERITQATEIDVAKQRFESMRGTKILLVGFRKDNLQPLAREHDDIVMWTTTDRTSSSIPPMPTNISVVMVSPRCSHQMSQRLKQMAADRKAFMFSGLLPSGQMRKHVAEILNLDKSKLHEGTTDDLGPIDMPPVAAAPKLVPKAPQPTREEPMPAKTTTTTVESPDAALDNAIDMLGNGIAALQLAREQLIQAKAHLDTARAQQSQLDADNAKAAAKLTALRELIKDL